MAESYLGGHTVWNGRNLSKPAPKTKAGRKLAKRLQKEKDRAWIAEETARLEAKKPSPDGAFVTFPSRRSP